MRRLLFFILVFTLGFSLFVNADFGDRVLKNGMSGNDVNTLQRYLSQLGYFHEEEFTNYFGCKTEEAVQKFQEEYDELEVDGIAGKATFKYIIAKINQINLVKEKEKKEKQLAASVQQDLKALGYYTGEITSKIDEATIEALRAFQEKEGFEVTGELDKTTQDRLNELFPKKVQEEKGVITGRALVDFMRKYLGTPYVYGASSGKAFDCSGFSTFVMKNFGIKIERTASQQARKGTPVKKKDLKIGDLVFFSQNGKRINHVGIYIGDNKFIHASSYRKRIVIDDLNKYTGVFMGATRYLNIKDDEELEGE